MSDLKQWRKIEADTMPLQAERIHAINATREMLRDGVSFWIVVDGEFYDYTVDFPPLPNSPPDAAPSGNKEGN